MENHSMVYPICVVLSTGKRCTVPVAVSAQVSDLKTALRQQVSCLHSAKFELYLTRPRDATWLQATASDVVQLQDSNIPEGFANVITEDNLLELDCKLALLNLPQHRPKDDCPDVHIIAKIVEPGKTCAAGRTGLKLVPTVLALIATVLLAIEAGTTTEYVQLIIRLIEAANCAIHVMLGMFSSCLNDARIHFLEALAAKAAGALVVFLGVEIVQGRCATEGTVAAVECVLYFVHCRYLITYLGLSDRALFVLKVLLPTAVLMLLVGGVDFRADSAAEALAGSRSDGEKIEDAEYEEPAEYLLKYLTAPMVKGAFHLMHALME